MLSVGNETNLVIFCSEISEFLMTFTHNLIYNVVFTYNVV